MSGRVGDVANVDVAPGQHTEEPVGCVDGVDGSRRVVDGWRKRTRRDVGQEANRKQGVLVEGTFDAPDDRPFDQVVGYVAAMDVGDWGTLVQGVTDSDTEHDDGVRPGGGVDEGQKIELLNDSRRTAPGDGSTQRCQQR